MESLHFQYPEWFLLLCIGLGVLFAVALYWRDHSFDDQQQWKRVMMAVLRGVTASVIAALLLAPFLKLFRQSTRQPVVVVVHDNSQSIAPYLNGEDSVRYVEAIRAIPDDLSGKFDVDVLRFGETIGEGLDLDFTDQITDISEALRYVQDQYANENLGAVILATDGLYNRGRQPLYSATNLKAPLKIIALGDTTTKTDLLVSKVLHNDIAFLGSKFPVQIDVAAQNLDGRRATLTLESRSGEGSGTVLFTETLNIIGDDFFTTREVLVDARTPGVNRYRARLTGIAGEETYNNNARDIYVEVIDGRLDVMILGNAPHPDIAALKEAITNNENYNVDAGLFSDFDKNPEEYDLFILHNLPSRRHDISALLNLLKENNIPHIFITGEAISIPRFNEAQDLLRIESAQQSTNEVTPIVEQDFALFDLSDEYTEQLKSFVPLYAPFGNYSFAPSAAVYMFQRIGSVDTQFPLVLFSTEGEAKTAIIAGEGIWRWRLYDYLQNDNQELTNTLINKAVQYVTVKEDKRRFRASPVKNLFTDIEAIDFTAELYNQSYELVNDPDAYLVVIDSAGNAYDFTFNKDNNSYSIDIGRFPVGNYSYRAYTDYAGQRLEARGRFSIKEIQLEQFQTTADHALLYEMARRYGGTVHYPSEIEKVKQELLNNDQIKPVVYSSAQNTPVIDLKWLFGLLLLLLALEWFLRRYLGGY